MKPNSIHSRGYENPFSQTLSVADPGFPRGGGANSPGGRQHIIWPNFPKNCMKLIEFGPPEGGGARVQNFTM